VRDADRTNAQNAQQRFHYSETQVAVALLHGAENLEEVWSDELGPVFGDLVVADAVQARLIVSSW
jgi:ubiquinone biosynthesis protein UbiJ